MKQIRPTLILTLIVLVLPLALAPRSEAGRGDTPDLKPGPSVITPEERAIVADPEHGIEHAVILVEETARNEDLPSDTETGYHLRAKILSNEGRDLANIALPAMERGAKLKEWWGRTILPDGQVLELKREDLERQVLARTKSDEVEGLKAALPGVVPGCVIDYGYLLREPGYYNYTRIPMQRAWPVKKFLYWWKPYRNLQGAYRTVLADGLDVRAGVKNQSMLIVGNDLPAVVDEPFMPPDPEARAALILYYMPIGTDFDTFWERIGTWMERLVKESIRKKRTIDDAVETIGLPAGGPLEQRLTLLYDWMTENLTRTGLRTFEEIESASEDEKRKNNLIANVMERREGNGLELQLLFIAIARSLGAEAHLVMVTDRTENYFDLNLRSLRQFDGTVVAVRPSKNAPDSDIVFVDPCSGLSYGEVPWWFTGQHGMLLEKDGGRAIELPVSGAGNNLSETRVAVSFTDENELRTANWHVVRKGQAGLNERHHLRRLSPEDRQRRIERLCGAGGDTEVVEAKVEALQEVARDLVLDCDTERWGDSLENIDTYHFTWTGPWVHEIPDLTDDERVHPVVFSYPYVDVVHMTVTAPEGFATREPQAPAEVENEFGRYELLVRREDDKYVVERAFSLYPVLVPVERYGAFRAFLDSVRRLERAPLVFEREGEP